MVRTPTPLLRLRDDRLPMRLLLLAYTERRRDDGGRAMTPDALAERHRIATAIRDLTNLTACYPPEIRDVLTTIAGRVERGEL